MRLDEHFKRRVRIEGKANETLGRRLIVRDLETGEEIEHVTRVTIYLDANGKQNRAELTYAIADAHGRLLQPKRGKLVEKTISVDNPEVALTAWETFNPDGEV